MVGFSWEHSFDGAVTDVANLNEAHKRMTKFALGLIVVARARVRLCIAWFAACGPVAVGYPKRVRALRFDAFGSSDDLRTGKVARQLLKGRFWILSSSIWPAIGQDQVVVARKMTKSCQRHLPCWPQVLFTLAGTAPGSVWRFD